MLAIVAGTAAVNAVIGRRGFVDGTDFFTCWELSNRANCKCVILPALRVAENLVKGVLWESVLTCATILHDHHVLDREQMRDAWFAAQPDAYPWAITARREIDALWRLHGRGNR
jgi:hypothetical protein